MRIVTPAEGYHLNAQGIKSTEDRYKARYMGYWCVKTRSGWSDMPVDVFYVADPDRSKGHSNYFGIYVYSLTGQVMICNAESAFSQPISGVVTADGEVLVSRYRHDCVSKGDLMIDGGRDYLRCSAGADLVHVVVIEDQFVFQEAPQLNSEDEVDEN